MRTIIRSRKANLAPNYVAKPAKSSPGGLIASIAILGLLGIGILVAPEARDGAIDSDLGLAPTGGYESAADVRKGRKYREKFRQKELNFLVDTDDISDISDSELRRQSRHLSALYKWHLKYSKLISRARGDRAAALLDRYWDGYWYRVRNLHPFGAGVTTLPLEKPTVNQFRKDAPTVKWFLTMGMAELLDHIRDRAKANMASRNGT